MLQEKGPHEVLFQVHKSKKRLHELKQVRGQPSPQKPRSAKAHVKTQEKLQRVANTVPALPLFQTHTLK